MPAAFPCQHVSAAAVGRAPSVVSVVGDLLQVVYAARAAGLRLRVPVAVDLQGVGPARDDLFGARAHEVEHVVGVLLEVEKPTTVVRHPEPVPEKLLPAVAVPV